MRRVDDGYRMLAGQCLRKQARKLARQIKLVGAQDQIEVIHQARVAARRLAAAFGAFARHLPRKKAKRWRRDIRRTLKQLGAARDKDVQIECLRATLKQTSDRTLRPGIRRIMVRTRQQRQALQPKVLKAARRLRKSGTLKAIRRRADAMLAEFAHKDKPIQTPAVFAARQKILKALDHVVAYESCLYDPAAIARHHEMRIVAKKLRYTMELFGPAYEGELDAPIAATKKLQDMLGELHDCDVWLELLGEFINDERKRVEDYFGKASPVKRLEAGIEHLQATRSEDRERIFAELGTYWQKLSKAETWQSLTAMLNEHFARAEADAAKKAEAAAKAAEQARQAHADAADKAKSAQATLREAESYSSENAQDTSNQATSEPEPSPETAEPENAPPGEHQAERQTQAKPTPSLKLNDNPMASGDEIA